MRVLLLTPGTGSFLCGSCIRDNSLSAALRRAGHDPTIMPLYLPAALFAGCFHFSAYPLYRSRKRKKLGLCVACGYDLRGSAGCCPECGTEIPA